MLPGMQFTNSLVLYEACTTQPNNLRGFCSQTERATSTYFPITPHLECSAYLEVHIHWLSIMISIL